MTQLDTAQWHKEDLDDIAKTLEGGIGEKEADFNKCNSVLIKYKIIDADLNLLFKGKVASKASGYDNILITEFFFSGLI